MDPSGAPQLAQSRTEGVAADPFLPLPFAWLLMVAVVVAAEEDEGAAPAPSPSPPPSMFNAALSVAPLRSGPFPAMGGLL